MCRVLRNVFWQFFNCLQFACIYNRGTETVGYCTINYYVEKEHAGGTFFGLSACLLKRSKRVVYVPTRL
jgi:hypothetical protein